ncbi:MAG: HEPN domain-containing protein, partial [Candidatus Competibacteraceae bacterium]
QSDSTVSISVRERRTVTKETLSPALTGISKIFRDSQNRERFQIALELYAAHFTEQQVRVRFLILVMAIESLAISTNKHPVAIELLDRWKDELKSEKEKFERSSEAWQSLEALCRELNFRSYDSIGEKVRKVFSKLPGVSSAEARELQRRATRLYNKRSILLHKGCLPSEELPALEDEARELLERVFASAIT